MPIIQDSRPHKIVRRVEPLRAFGARGWLSLFAVAVFAFWFVAGL